MKLRFETILFLLSFLLATTSFASNPGVSYQGRIFKPDGSPLEGTNVQFRMQVRSPGSENCLLYEEVQTLNMAGSSGVFSLTMNDGTGTRLDAATYQVDRIFANRDTMTLDSARCAAGTAYAPNAADGRKLIVYFKDETMAAYEAMPIMNLNYVPQAMYALEAQKVGTFAMNTLLRAVDGSGNPAVVPAFDPAQLTNLNNLIAGASTQYATTAQFNTVQAFAKVTLPTCNTGEVLKSNGTAFSCVTDSGGGGSGTVTSVTSANSYLSVATGTTTPALTLNVGTAANTVAAGNDSRITGALQSGTAAGGSLTGTYPNPTIAAGAVTNTEISASAAIADSKLATISTAGKVSGSAITSGTIGGSTIISTSGNIQTTGVLRVYDAGPTNSVSLKAPTTVTTSYDLTFPSAKPSVAGYLLAGDTSGNLTWVAPNSGSVTSVTATAPVVSTGGATPVISMAPANTTTAGYLSSADWNTFNSKQSTTLANGSILVGNGSSVATAVAPSGDVTMTNAGAFTVTKLQGSAVSSTTPTTSGQMLRFNGTQWVPNFISMFDLRSTITGAATFASGCTPGQTLTWTSATDNLACTNIAITGSQVSGNISGNAANVTGIVAAANGGTGQSSYTVGDLLYASTTSALSRLPAGTNGQVLTSGGAGVAPSWAASGANTWTVSGSDVYRSAGTVGIGTATPATKLDVAGGVRIGTEATACAAGLAGTLRYNATSIEYCNGSSWQAFGVSGAGLSSLGGQTGSTQTFAVAATGTAPAINSATNTHTLSIPLASGTGVTSGTISKTDYDNFNNKIAPTTGTSGGIPYFSSSTTLVSSAALTANGVVLGGGAGATPVTTAAGTANQVLRIPAGGGAPAFGSIDLSSASVIGTSVLPIANGGTNSSAALSNGKVMVSSGGAIVEGLASSTTKSNNTFVMRDGSGNIAGALGSFDQLSILNGGTAGLYGSISGYVALQASPTTSSYTLTLPTSAGTNGYVLATNGSGGTSWVAQSGGSGTAVDYSGYTSQTLGTSYTASTPGIVTAYATRNTGTCTLTATVTPVSAASFTISRASTTVTTTVNVTFPVKNGDSYQVTQTNCTTTPVQYFMAMSGTGGTIASGGSGTAGYLSKWSSASDLTNSPLFIDSNSKIGVGTTSPSYTFDVQTTGANAAGLNLRSSANDALVNLDSSSGYSRVLHAVGGSTQWSIGTRNDSNYYLFRESGSGNVVVPSGNVGIGTSSPSYTLDVQSNTGWTDGQARFYKTAGGADNQVRVSFGAASSADFWSIVADPSTTGSNSKYYFFNSTLNSAVMTLLGNGNVGIGTSAPQKTFEVVNAGANYQAAFRSSTSTATSGILMMNDANSTSRGAEFGYSGSAWAGGLYTGGLPGEQGYFGTVGNYPLSIGTNNTQRMTILGTGNVGIGTTSPQTMFQVEGVISPATNNLHTLGSASYRFTQVYATNGVINTSDRREKKDIYDTDLGLDFINKLRPVSYRWNTGIDDEVHYGLIAQEAEQALADAGKTEKTSIVTHDESTDRYGVRYSELISPLIKAAQEIYSRLIGVEAQQKSQAREIASIKVDTAQLQVHDKDNAQEIEKLKKDNAEKSKEIESLKARLEKIEKALSSK